MKHIFAAASLCAILSGCVGVPAAIVGGGALGTALQVASAAPVILSDAAKAACDIQAGINAYTDSAGDPMLVRGLAVASAVAGAKCVW